MSIAQTVATALADNCEQVALAILDRPTSTGRHEWRWGKHGSFALQLTGAKRGFWFDHERGEGGDMLHLIARDRGASLGQAIVIAKHEFLNGRIEVSQVVRPRSPLQEVGKSEPWFASDDSTDRAERARDIWKAAGELRGSLGERYLIERRGIDIRSLDIGHCLRWHSGINGIVALMTDPTTNKFAGVHRTYLAADGSKLERKMLGRQGVVRLSRETDVSYGLGLVEGIEDGLAVLLSGWRPVWAATSAGAIARFPVLAGIDALTVFADLDAAGSSAAQQCVANWIEQGREARVSPPPGELPK